MTEVHLMNEVIKIGVHFKTSWKRSSFPLWSSFYSLTLGYPAFSRSVFQATSFTYLWLTELCCVCPQDRERQNAQIGNMVEFAIALIGKLDGINRHSFNTFRLRVGTSDYRNLNSTPLLLLELILAFSQTQDEHFISTYCIDVSF